MRFLATISECFSSRFGGAHVASYMTGWSVRTIMPERWLASMTRVSTTIVLWHALIFTEGTTRKVTLVSLRMGFSSVDCTRCNIGLNHARTTLAVRGGCVSSLTHRSSLGFYLSRVPGMPITMMVPL